MLVSAPYRFALHDDKQTFVRLKNSPNEVWQFLEVEGSLMAATGQGLFMIRGKRSMWRVPRPKRIAWEPPGAGPAISLSGLMGGMEVFRQRTGYGLQGTSRWGT